MTSRLLIGWWRHGYSFGDDVTLINDNNTYASRRALQVTVEDADYDDNSHARDRRHSEYQPAILKALGNDVT